MGWLLMGALCAWGQIASQPATTTNQVGNGVVAGTESERVRTACVSGRRRICGRVVQVVADGLVVESGYPDLLRPALGRSWVVPRNVSATRPPNLVEENTAGAMCVGTVLVTDIPKKPKAKVHDYVVIQGFPAGSYHYSPLGTVEQTVRKFSAVLESAVELNLKAEAGKPAVKDAAGVK